jgi:FdhE protein
LSLANADGWLAAHEYLRPVAELCALVDRAAADVEPATRGAAVPSRDDYREEFLAGVPLLRSERVVVDLEPAGAMTAALARAVSSRASPGRVRDEAAALDAALRSEPDAARRIADWLLGDESWSPPSPGLLRYLGWTAAARFLRPVVEAFERSGEDERWMRGYCPTCGSSPAMAHLAEADASRARRMCCGLCRTRWQYPRTKCPFCEADSQRLSIVAVEGEGGLRIDYCPSCRGYLKTYAGQGNEALLLSDWSSLHLDLIAHDRGLKKLAAALYEFEPARLP